MGNTGASVAKGKKNGRAQPGGHVVVSRELLLGSCATLALLLASAFAVIYSTHACRELYTQLQLLEAAQWSLQEDYGRLLLQQSTLASHHEIETEARQELGMRAPDLARFRVVTQ